MSLLHDYDTELSGRLMDTMRRLYFNKHYLGLEDFLRGEMRVLSFIFHEDCRLLPGQIASSLEMTGGRIAGILRSLEKKGYITRQTDVADRRKIYVIITECGKEKIRIGTAELSEKLDAVIRIMGCERADQLIDSLNDYLNASEFIAENKGV